MRVMTFFMMQKTDSLLLSENSLQRGFVFLPCHFCLHSVLKLKDSRRTHFHTWHRTPCVMVINFAHLNGHLWTKR